MGPKGVPHYGMILGPDPIIEPGTSDTDPLWSTLGSGPPQHSQAIALADVDGDGDLDIVLGNTGGDASRVYRTPGPGYAQNFIRDSLRLDTGTPLLGTVGQKVIDVAVSPGLSMEGNAVT